MGVDFIGKIKKTFKKGIDRARIERGTPDLFSTKMTEEPRSYTVSLINSRHGLTDKSSVIVNLQDCGKIVIMKELDVIGSFISPSEELVQTLNASEGEACGRVVAVYDAAMLAEILVC